MSRASSTLDFNNTSIAFKSLSNTALRKAYWLFKVLGVSTLAKVGPHMVTAAMRMHLPVTWAIKRTIFDHFCGGESVEQCQRTVTQLKEYGIRTILDYSAEGKSDEEEFERTTKEISHTIERAKKSDGIAFCVFKVTGLARLELLEKVHSKAKLSAEEKKEFDRVKHRVELLCKQAFDSNVRIFIDAEETWIQDGIDDMALAMMRKYNQSKAIVYTTLQMYRHDRLSYLKKLHSIAVEENFICGVKLVRGAYMEKERARAKRYGYPSPIQPDKESTDRDFDAAVRYSIEHIDRIALVAGTHNEQSSKLLTDLMKQKNIAPNDPRIFFSQLYGMSDNLSYNLAHHKYNVAKYVPYGPVRTVLPYLFRRAEENTSIQKQTGRQLALIEAEMKRRNLI